MLAHVRSGKTATRHDILRSTRKKGFLLIFKYSIIPLRYLRAVVAADDNASPLELFTALLLQVPTESLSSLETINKNEHDKTASRQQQRW